jgi:hypothetical protein
LFVPGSIQLTFREGSTDKLSVNGTFTTSAVFDPVTTGARLQMSSEFVSVVDAQLGGPGAPVQFTESSGKYRYNDPTGVVDGITRVDIKPDNRHPGTYKLKVSGKNMNLDAVTRPDIRVQLDLDSAPACMETREVDLYCVWLSGGKKLRCR